jgi:Domain of unknown function (DUF3806)
MRYLLPLLMLFGLSLGPSAQAEDELLISDLSPIDLQYMQQQRKSLQELASLKLGRRFIGERKRDLSILQALLDNNLVKGEQTQELQAMGVILGDHLAENLGMHWIVYEDKLGRSRALRYKETGHFLFPITMISRRRAVGNTDSVEAIYQKAYDTIDALLDPLPFQ